MNPAVLGLRLQGPWPDLAEWPWLERHWLTPPPQHAPGGTLRLVREPPGPPPGSPQLTDASGVPVPFWAAGAELWLGADGGVGLRATPDGAELRAAREPAQAELLLALAEAARLRGWWPLHAAVAARGGRAVAVCGASGAGKSTAALRLHGAGYTVLAEDRAWVWPPDAEIVGLDRELRLRPGSLERFAPGVVAGELEQDAHGKRLLPLPPSAAGARLLAVLHLEPDLPPGTVPEPLSGAERVRRLFEAGGVPLTPSARAAAAQGAARLARLPGERVGREGLLQAVSRVLGGSEASGG